MNFENIWTHPLKAYNTDPFSSRLQRDKLNVTIKLGEYSLLQTTTTKQMWTCTVLLSFLAVKFFSQNVTWEAGLDYQKGKVANWGHRPLGAPKVLVLQCFLFTCILCPCFIEGPCVKIIHFNYYRLLFRIPRHQTHLVLTLIILVYCGQHWCA